MTPLRLLQGRRSRAATSDTAGSRRARSPGRGSRGAGTAAGCATWRPAQTAVLAHFPCPSAPVSVCYPGQSAECTLVNHHGSCHRRPPTLCAGSHALQACRSIQRHPPPICDPRKVHLKVDWQRVLVSVRQDMAQQLRADALALCLWPRPKRYDMNEGPMLLQMLQWHCLFRHSPLGFGAHVLSRRSGQYIYGVSTPSSIGARRRRDSQLRLGEQGSVLGAALRTCCKLCFLSVRYSSNAANSRHLANSTAASSSRSPCQVLATQPGCRRATEACWTQDHAV